MTSKDSISSYFEDQYIKHIDLLIDKMWSVRAVSEMQYNPDSSSLSNVQRTWLHNDYVENRDESEQWLDSLITEISAWFIRSYEKVIGNKAIKLGEIERMSFANVVNGSNIGQRNKSEVVSRTASRDVVIRKKIHS